MHLVTLLLVHAALYSHLVHQKRWVEHIHERGGRAELVAVARKYDVAQSQLVVPRVETHL